jgi:3-methyladenine DNA glycosylase AlkD
MNSIAQIEKRLRSMADPAQASILQRFFKTAPGEYGAGDIFLGIRVPRLRALTRECGEIPLTETLGLLRSPLHEQRLLALLLLAAAYARGDAPVRAAVYHSYLAHTRWINNWDLVDLSAPRIVGAHLLERRRKPLDRLAQSDNLWERRIAIVATFPFIRQGQFGDTLRVADLLLTDPHDLIHKAVGWMLREVGKRDLGVTEAFLAPRCRRMPRTMLRYAIERFSEERRQAFLKGEMGV